jgi:zinc/manganese transport system substrate-binding protein
MTIDNRLGQHIAEIDASWYILQGSVKKMTIRMIRCLVFLIVMFLSFTTACRAGKVTIVTTTTDLADFATNVGGDQVNVYSLAKGTEDPHFIEPKPSHILKLKKADLYLVMGMQLEVGYSPVLEKGAGRPEIMFGGRDYIDCSAGIRAQDIPNKADRSMGDVHPQGNPHYLLDPANAIIVVNTIAQALKAKFPEKAEYFEKNRIAYTGTLQGKIAEWRMKMLPVKGRDVVTYHKLWTYFLTRYGINYIGSVEPFPGIAPSPAHIAQLIELMKAKKCKTILMANYYERKTPDAIAQSVGGKVLVLPVMTRSTKEVTDYISLIDYIVNRLSEDLQ